MARTASAGPADTAYLDEITMMLRDQLRQVIKVREPKVLAVIDEPADAVEIPPDLIEHALQVIGIWLQLLNIAEENAAMRNRRQMENRSGPDQVAGSFSNAFSVVAAANVSPEAVQKALDTVDVQPTITAHPTEAKRVTVLEIHRRIYLKLYELESPRWTPRERAGLLKALRNEIDLLWLTGEIRLEKPTVEQEIHWGLHFFREALFDRTGTICDLLEAALQRHYPETPCRCVPPLKLFLVDRRRPRRQPLRHGRCHPLCIAGEPRRHREPPRPEAERSGAARFAEFAGNHLSPAFAERVARQTELSGRGRLIRTRNSYEPFRQFFSALRLRLARPSAGIRRGQGFSDTGELIEELLAAEETLANLQSVSIASTLVRPVRWEVETFGFRSMSLDIRQNTTVINRVLQEIWGKLNPSGGRPARPGTAEWSKWINEELDKPLGFLPRFRGISEEARELLDLLDLIRDTIDGPDRRRSAPSSCP
jgi:phosphoenolpyruvate carboxylase